MHIAEGILPLRQAAVWTAALTPWLWLSGRSTMRILREGPSASRAMLQVAGALTFAVTLFPTPVPVLGVSSHLCATPLIGLLLGPRLLVLPTMATLLVQALFFAHGGLTTLGVNTFALGVLGPVLAVGLARGLRQLGVSSVVAVGLACALADWGIYGFDALALGWALAGHKPFTYWFHAALLGFAPVQGPLGLLEGVLSAFAFRALVRRRAELGPAWLCGNVRADVRRFPNRRAAAPLLLCLFLASPPVLALPRYQGLDETVIAARAREAGRPVGAETDEPTIFLVALSTFVAGFIVGRGWNSLTAGRGTPRAS